MTGQTGQVKPLISPPLLFLELKVSPYASRSRAAHELWGMAPSGSATEHVEHLQTGSTCQYTRYWATGLLEDADNWVWSKNLLSVR